MCLAVPGRIMEVTGDDPFMRAGRVSFGGVVRDVNLAFVPDAAVGDYVLVHAGVAIHVIDECEAERTFEYLRQLEELGEELMGHLCRHVFLRTIDAKWRDHLHALDSVREAGDRFRCFLLEGVTGSTAVSKEGSTTITLTFEPGWDLGRATEDVKASVEGVRWRSWPRTPGPSWPHSSGSHGPVGSSPPCQCCHSTSDTQWRAFGNVRTRRTSSVSLVVQPTWSRCRCVITIWRTSRVL